MKSNQKSSHQIGFSRSWPLPGKTDKTTGCIICPLLRSLKAYTLGQKTLCPSRRTPTMFYQFSPEAFLLTVLHNNETLRIPALLQKASLVWAEFCLIVETVKRAASGERRQNTAGRAVARVLVILSEAVALCDNRGQKDRALGFTGFAGKALCGKEASRMT
jgi:hypothetical protein